MVKHPIILRGYGADPLDDQAAPVLVKRTDPEFVDGVLDKLRERAPRAQLGEPLDRPGGRLKLRQPIHRTFNLVVLEAACDRPGRPRLNPRQIESAGFVVRRVRNAGQARFDESWQRRGKSILGWHTPGSAGAARLDPDPTRRPARGLPLRSAQVPAGVHRALELIRREAEPAAEAVTPLFVAPPDVCEAAGRTVLYGVVPVSSAEFREDRPAETYDDEVVMSLMPEFLRVGTGNYEPNGASRTLTPLEVEAAEATGLTGTLGLFLLGVRSLHSVLRIFSDPRDAVFVGLLNERTVRVDGSDVRLGDYLERIASELIERRKEGLTVSLPEKWPFPSADQAADFAREAKRILNAQFARQGVQIRRFEEPGALYRIHAFVRTREDAECPPELHWAAPSEVFTIAPWWETGPLHTIQLPDLNDLKNLKPNVAFALPPGLANLLNRSNPKKLAEGEGSTGGLELGWICSFSLPAITLCAFIVLNIFLSLFDLIFQWLFFIKICLPFPKKLSPPAP
jgi:hypothetical protein